MSTEILVIIITSVLLLIAIIAVVVCVVRISGLNRNMTSLTGEKAALEGQKIALEGQLKAQDETYRALDAQREQQYRELEAQRAEARKAIAEEREKAFESQRKQMEESFKALSEQNSNVLRKQNADSIVELLKPVKEKFDGFEKSVRESQEKSVERDAAMRESIKLMMEQSRSVGSEARNLANALTGHSKIQGNFGEMLLVDLLKQSGLEEGIHFTTQDVIRDDRGHEVKSEAGTTMLPDVIVNYPDGSQVIIDSKVSLNAYVEYMNSESVDERQTLARKHVESVSKHIDELKLKDYASYISEGRRKVDYNIMFIPMEGAFRLMLDQAPTLWQRAKDAKVLIVSQQNLMIVLNMILMSWRQHDQEKNIAEVYKTAGEMMGQLKNWMDAFVKVGDYIGKAQSAYDDSRQKLMDSSQSVIRKIDKLERLKLAPKRSNAKIKAGARVVAGQESIIPSELAGGLEQEETIKTIDQ